MSNFVFAYTGGAMAETAEAQEAAMQAWMGWFGTLGDAVVAVGNPFGASVAVQADGSRTPTRAALGGYSVVQAGSLEDAAALAKGCPVLDGGGAVEVYEAIPVM